MNRTNVVAMAIAVAIFLGCFFGYKALSKPKDTGPVDPMKQLASMVTAKDGKFDVKIDEKFAHSLADSRRKQMLDEYFALPEGKPRKDYLDTKIDEMEKVRKMMESDPPTTQPGMHVADGKDGNKIVKKFTMGGPSAAQQKEMAESLPADVQARLAQYVKEMKDRRAERGLPDGPAGIMIQLKVPGPGPGK